MTIYKAAITLFLVMDSLGNIPIFLSALRTVDARRRQYIILRETLIALIILTIFLFFGKYILQGAQISIPALTISGGIILFLIAIKMIFPSDTSGRQQMGEPFIVPLALPLIAGPTTMAVLMLMAAREPGKIWEWFAALLIAWAVGTLLLISGEYLRKILGETGLNAMERLMGMILTTMAVQMFLNGIAAFFHL